MVMLPTLRVKRTRPPLAEMSMFSSDVGAVEEHGIGAGLALDDVAAVARVPHEGVVAGAQQRHVVALTAVDQVVALAADQHVGTVAAVERQFDQAGLQSAGIDDVVTALGS